MKTAPHPIDEMYSQLETTSTGCVFRSFEGRVGFILEGVRMMARSINQGWNRTAAIITLAILVSVFGALAWGTFQIVEALTK